MSAKQTRNRRERIRLQQANICPYCDCQMTDVTGHPQAPTMVTLDHFVPIELGGSNRLENAVVCCLRCNYLKKGHTVESLRKLADRLETLALTRTEQAV